MSRDEHHRLRASGFLEADPGTRSRCCDLQKARPPGKHRIHGLFSYLLILPQVWFGTGVGLALCLVIGAGIIGAFYSLRKNRWSGTEDNWEGTLGLIASLIISIVGAALLRISKLQDKWRVKLARQLEAADSTGGKIKGNRFKLWCEKYAMFLLPFITVLREGLEAVVFIGGVGLGLPASSFPLAVICGLACGALIGFFIYK